MEDRPSNKGGPPKAPVSHAPESSGIASLTSLKAAGRAFSFGRKKAELGNTVTRPRIDHAQTDGSAHYTRERAYTESSHASESTATPPKLLDTGLDFGSTDNFGRMFESFDNAKQQDNKGQSALGFIETESPRNMTPTGAHDYPGAKRMDTASASAVWNKPALTGGSRPWAESDVIEEFSLPKSHAMERTFSYENGQEKIDYGPPQKSKTAPLPIPVNPLPQHISGTRKFPVQASRSSTNAAQKISAHDPASATYHDADARLVMDSISASRRLERSYAGGVQDSDDEDNPTAHLVPQSKASQGPQPSSTTSRLLDTRDSPPSWLDARNRRNIPMDAHKSSAGISGAKIADISHEEERSMFDASPPLPIRTAAPTRPRVHHLPKAQTQNKIMTPTQFERYKKEQEMNSAISQQTSREESDEDGNSDDDEDEDEAERNKQVIKQRRKQEAHMAVYRQQMMKMTGDQPADLSSTKLRPSLDRSSASTPNLVNRSSAIEINFDKPKNDGRASDDEDEDVPLGVLAAHGFPSKNRPPSATGARDSRVQYKSESYPPPPASTSGASHGGRASGLPPFARNLPQDPYFGASLVNPSNRESLAYNHQGSGLVFGGPQPNVPAGGLVGVIAGEEQARAARRGSPNHQGNYGSPLPPGMTQIPGMPPGMPPMMTAQEQATAQMSEQMNQMVQMQMQWMQQMQQMMAAGMQFPPGQQIPPMAPGPSPVRLPSPMQPASGQPQRPNSSGPHATLGAPKAPPLSGRAMSMMGSTGPSHTWASQQMNHKQSVTAFAGGGLGGSGAGYAPSIAPSERSNVGMPSRYRPVSTAPPDEQRSQAHSRTSTMNSNTLRPGGASKDGRLSTSRERKSNLSLRPESHAIFKKAGSDDDDDEEGWEEMKLKREKKRNLWRLNKKKDEQSTGGLEYYDYSEE